MQNDRPVDILRTPAAPATALEQPFVDDLSLNVPLTPDDSLENTIVAAPQPKTNIWLRLAAVAAGVLVLTIVSVLVLARSGGSQNQELKSGSYGITQLPLGQIKNPSLSLDNATQVQVNGQLQVSNSIVLTPIGQPTNPVLGQLYFDKTSNLLAYYNGQQFLTLGGNTPTNTNTTNVTNILGSTQTNVQLQTTSPGVQQTGNFNISGVGAVGTLETTVITSNGGTLYINPASATAQQQVAAGTPGTIGLTSGASPNGPGWNNVLSATKVTMGAVSGTAQSISVVLLGGSSAKHVQLGLYDDDGDVPSKPGNLLATSAVANLVPNGTTTITIPQVTLNANNTYWLAMNTDDATVSRTFNSGNKATCFVSKGFGFMPDPFSAPGCFYDNNVYTIYLNYLSGTGASGGTSQAALVIGADGSASFQNSTDSTTAFRVQNAAANSTILDIDTVNSRIGIGKTTPAYKLDVAGGDVNLSNGHSLRFGGLQVVSVNSSASAVSITNFNSGGSVSAQADNFYVQDANASHQSLAINSVGASTFSNRIDSTTGFQIQNAVGTVLLRADTTNLSIIIGNPGGSATPVVLYLANKNTAGDPATGAEGGTYYNSTLASFRCFHTGFWQDCSDIEPQHSFSFYDDFLGGQTSFSGQIGSLGWTAAAIGANGSLSLNPATPAPSADRPGVLQLTTTGTANQGTSLLLGDTTGGSTIIAKDNDVKTAVAVGAATGQVLRIGLHGETTTTTQPVSGVWWEADPGTNANWRYCYGDGTTATCANTAVAITANTWVTLEIRVTATGGGTSAATFVINNTPFTVSAVTIDTTNRVSPALTCYTTLASAHSCDWDYFQFTGTTSTRR
ncbi:MAG TPA: hypothetical protein VJP80_06170 [Candidatus Saccharimonadales bacterium]|nr:hypothetical protein [Candidatus Saccharimonadales bacterium]